MNCQIVRRDGYDGSILILDKNGRDQICQLGKTAEAILEKQDEVLWDEASNPEFLKLAIGGAIVLQEVGRPSDYEVLIDDEGAHMAFMCCNALSLFVSRLSADKIAVLKEVLKIVSLCCPIKVQVGSLPPLSSMPKNFQENPLIVQQFYRFEETLGKSEETEVTLGDALAILKFFKASKNQDFAKPISALEELTEGLSTALSRLRGAQP